MNVTFDFAGEDGPVDLITVTDCPPDLLEELQDAAAGLDPESVFRIRASANGDEPRMLLFRSRRISNVEVVK